MFAKMVAVNINKKNSVWVENHKQLWWSKS